jgi:dynein heavy chain
MPHRTAMLRAGSLVWWTWEVEDAFRAVKEGDKHAMKTLEARLTRQLNELVAMVRQDLNKINRKKVNTLLIIDVHSRDIVDSFIRESILNAKEFAWESQLRFYWDRDVDDCVIKQCTGFFRYGYEYMGLNGRLVITPLTDRCYMTITQALTFKLGGSPAGPAGTGKTETVKDLAKSLALPCFVINCGEGLDYKAMGSIFSGLVQVGAWGCFDEFNRINIEVLSVVSAQLRSIQNALIYDNPTCDIGNGDISVKRVAGFATCGFFITMNPGYAGRTELPDNLKALFRPVTMIVPDLQMICEIMLFSEGFEGAKVLARKMTVLYKLSKEQLSKQDHYDLGLRSLKSVLVMAGGLKRQYSDLREDIVLMRVLRDSNMPKYVFEDVPLFKGLIKDLFPGLDAPRVGYEELKVEVASHLTLHGYKCSDDAVHREQCDKVIQMYETMIVRCVPSCGGAFTLSMGLVSHTRCRGWSLVQI